MSTILNVSHSNVNRNYNKATNNQVSFEGKLCVAKKFENYFTNAVEKKEIFKMELFNIYNKNNFYNKNSEEEIDYLTKIMKLVDKPSEEHLKFVSDFDAPLSLLYRIFKGTENKKSRLNFAQKVGDLVFNKDSRPEIVAELLESPLNKEYVKKFDDIKSYLIYNRKNSNAVVHLDLLHYNKSFNGVVYDKILLAEKHKDEFPFAETDILNKSVFEEIYSEPVAKLTESLENYFVSISKEMMQNGNDKDILDMLKTTNSKNVELRAKIVEHFSGNYKFDNKKVEELSELNKLFDKLDNDKHARNFVKKSLPNLKYIISLKDLNEVLSNISTRKLDIYTPNVVNILSKVERQDRLTTLEAEIKNPFFETANSLNQKSLDIEYGLVEKPSRFSIIKEKIINSFRILKDNFVS